WLRPPHQWGVLRDARVLALLGQLVGEVGTVGIAGPAARYDIAGRTGVREVDPLPVHRQARHGERTALAPAVPGRLDGVGVAAHRHPGKRVVRPGRPGLPGRWARVKAG